MDALIGMCYFRFLLLSFYLYVQYSCVEIKEIFSFNLSCSEFFIHVHAHAHKP